MKGRQRQRGTYIQMARAECGFGAWDLGLIRHGIFSGEEGGVTPGPAVGAERLALTSLCCGCELGPSLSLSGSCQVQVGG